MEKKRKDLGKEGQSRRETTSFPGSFFFPSRVAREEKGRRQAPGGGVGGLELTSSTKFDLV